MNKIVGHTLLAKLGKTRLRPGGIKGTKWLKAQVDFNNKELLEVAPNMGTTAIELAKKYSVNINAVDLDEKALDKARLNAKKHKVDNKINFIKANATSLPFEDNKFDIILNEAMLTMLSNQNKEKAVSQYFRVLKDGGKLLTHDVCLLTDDENLQKEIIADLSRAINIHVQPKTIKNWLELYNNAGFSDIKYLSGPMSLLRPIGMIRDEGLFRTLKIIKNSRKKENKDQFKLMYKIFKKYKKELGFIVVASKK